jgi:F-type H+-transporting ATPase subunit b
MNSRSTRWILSLVVFAAIVGFAAAPYRLHAQEATPAVQSAPATGSAATVPAEKAESKTSEEEETTAFRHTPLVASLAKLFHLSVETTARLFEYINFAIIALAIVIPLVRILPKVLQQRARTIKHDIDEARKVTEDAKTRLSAVEARLSKLDEEISAIRTHVESEARNDEARIKSTIEEESGRIVAAAEQEIAAAAAHERRGLRSFAADLAIEQAARQLVLTPEADRALIAEFVSEAAKGVQN